MLGEAAMQAHAALSIAERFAAEDPANVDWQRELGRSHYRVGTIADARGSRAEARAHLERAADIMDRLARLDSLNPARRRDLAEARAALAQHLLAPGETHRALREARAVQENRRPLARTKRRRRRAGGKAPGTRPGVAGKGLERGRKPGAGGRGAGAGG